MHDRPITLTPYGGHEDAVTAWPDGAERGTIICSTGDCSVCAAHLIEWAADNPRWYNVLATIQKGISADALLQTMGLAFDLRSLCYLMASERFRYAHSHFFTNLYRSVVGDANTVVGCASNSTPECIAYVQTLGELSGIGGSHSIHDTDLRVVDKPEGGFIPDPPIACDSGRIRKRERAPIRNSTDSESYLLAALFDSILTSNLIQEGNAEYRRHTEGVRVAGNTHPLGFPTAPERVDGRSSYDPTVGRVSIRGASTPRNNGDWLAGVRADLDTSVRSTPSGERHGEAVPVGSDTPSYTCRECGFHNVPNVSGCSCGESPNEPVGRTSTGMTRQRCSWCGNRIPTDMDSRFCCSTCECESLRSDNPEEECTCFGD